MRSRRISKQKSRFPLEHINGDVAPSPMTARIPVMWRSSHELLIKRAIHRSSIVEFLELGKEKTIVSFKNRWKLGQMDGSDGIFKPSVVYRGL
ncbi:hypothetical protein AVEN_85458-1 [Araneus ventricosus]|uniref:Uncharacterized protein n=1 Tax=Araneus ventricosus TaxID=182803 RepID=A0A4Y2GXS4_ARAVE|nr:hypothetical protein AVEN_85458-1 [Araneus ventricosus]